MVASLKTKSNTAVPLKIAHLKAQHVHSTFVLCALCSIAAGQNNSFYCILCDEELMVQNIIRNNCSKYCE